MVLLPTVVQFGALSFNRLGCGCAFGMLGVVLASWWWVGFFKLDSVRILFWGECVNKISSFWSASAPLPWGALWAAGLFTQSHRSYGSCHGSDPIGSQALG